MIDLSRSHIYAQPKSTYLDSEVPAFHFDSSLPPNKLEYLAALTMSTGDCNRDLRASGIRGDVTGGSAVLTSSIAPPRFRASGTAGRAPVSSLSVQADCRGEDWLSDEEGSRGYIVQFHEKRKTRPDRLEFRKHRRVTTAEKVCRRMCRTLRVGMRQYGLFRYFDKVLPCGLGFG
jgi:hypothetical protein